MKMELGIEIKFVFRMEIMFGLVTWYNIRIRVRVVTVNII